jgi:hypothetical protein
MASGPGFIGVKHSRIEHTIQLKGDVVGGDGTLTGYLNRRLLQALHVGDTFQYWD